MANKTKIMINNGKYVSSKSLNASATNISGINKMSKFAENRIVRFNVFGF